MQAGDQSYNHHYIYMVFLIFLIFIKLYYMIYAFKTKIQRSKCVSRSLSGQDNVLISQIAHKIIDKFGSFYSLNGT